MDNNSGDSEDEENFWDQSLPLKRSHLKNKLDNGELDDYVSAKLVVSVAEVLCAVETYCEHYGLPVTGLEHMCQMFNSFFDKPVVPDTRYSIDELLRTYDVVEFHAVCLKCNRYVCSFNGTESIVFCTQCNSNIKVKGNNVNFFVILNINEKVRHLLETNDQYYSDLLNTLCQSGEFIQDIHNGLKYKEFVCSLPDDEKKSYVSCVFNTDGSPVWKSANFSIWPIQIQLNELPLNVRFSNTVTCALWFGRSKPNMNIFVKTFAQHVNNLNVDGISCEILDRLLKIRLYPICCCVDTTARAPLQGLTQFNGYFGCNWCLHPGKPVKHKKKKVVKYPLLD